MAQGLITKIKNNTGSTIPANKLVYVTGFDEDSQNTTVGLADYTDENKLPALGLTVSEIENGAHGSVRTAGLIHGLDTSNVSVNSGVFVGENGNVIFIDPDDSDTNTFTSQQLGVVVTSNENGQILLFPIEVSSSHTQYTLIDGSRSFTSAVSGITPTINSHLATKAYVDLIEPGGNNTEIQFNSSGDFGGDSNLTWDNTNKRLTVGIITASTTGIEIPLVVKATSTGNMANTFGPGIQFNIQDNAGVSNPIAQIAAAMISSDDDSGMLALGTYFNGVLTEHLTIGNTGHVGIGTGITTEPAAPLHIKGVHTDIRLEDTSDDSWHTIKTGTYGALWISADEGQDAAGSFIRLEVDTNHIMTLEGTGNVGIGVDNPNDNAILDVTSTTKAFMPPRMTTTQRDNISSPTEGMLVYNITTHQLEDYNGSTWGAV
jgi:hypothetical protein